MEQQLNDDMTAHELRKIRRENRRKKKPTTKIPENSTIIKSDRNTNTNINNVNHETTVDICNQKGKKTNINDVQQEITVDTCNQKATPTLNKNSRSGPPVKPRKKNGYKTINLTDQPISSDHQNNIPQTISPVLNNIYNNSEKLCSAENLIPGNKRVIDEHTANHVLGNENNKSKIETKINKKYGFDLEIEDISNDKYLSQHKTSRHSYSTENTFNQEIQNENNCTQQIQLKSDDNKNNKTITDSVINDLGTVNAVKQIKLDQTNNNQSRDISKQPKDNNSTNIKSRDISKQPKDNNSTNIKSKDILKQPMENNSTNIKSRDILKQPMENNSTNIKSRDILKQPIENNSTNIKSRDILKEPMGKNSNHGNNSMINCPNKCGVKRVKKKMVNHCLSCILENTKCKYYALGCKSTISRQDLQQHYTECIDIHNLLQRAHNLEQNIEELKLEDFILNKNVQKMDRLFLMFTKRLYAMQL